MAYTYAGQYGPETLANLSGLPLRNFTIIVYQVGTTTPVTLYTDRTKTTVLSSAGITTTNNIGNLTFWCEPGRYDIVGNSQTLSVVVIPDIADMGGGSGSGITQLTGDVTAGPGSGSVAATLTSVGTAGTGYTKVNTDAKGRVIAGTTLSASDIPDIAESQVTNLVSDLSAINTSLGTKAVDTAVVHKATSETISGVKTFSVAPITIDAVANTEIPTYQQIPKYVSGKNKIINGDFVVNQRGTVVASTTGAFFSDRWRLTTSSAILNAQISIATAGIPTYTPQGYPTNFSNAYVSNPGGVATTAHFISQRIEDSGTLAGNTVTVSFYYSSTTNKTFRVGLAQVYGTGGTGTAGTDASFTYQDITVAGVTSGTYGRATVTITLPVLDTSGYTNYGSLSYLELRIGPGINYTTNSFLTNFWGIQVEYGPVATPFTLMTGTPGTEYQACLRYYYKLGGLTSAIVSAGIARATSTTAVELPVKHPVPMLQTAAMTRVGMTTRGAATSTFTGASFVSGSRDVYGGLYTFTGATGLTTNVYYIITTTSTSDYLEFSAEL